MTIVKLWRCEICGDPYIGKVPPANCPFCGSHRKHIKEAKSAVVNFNVELNEKDRAIAEESLKKEISNTAFYFCAASKTDNPEGKLLFKALAKVENEHASIWKKILKLDTIPAGADACHTVNKDNLQESHDRETRTIKFYRKSAKEVTDTRVKEILQALIKVEIDHLKLSEERLNPR
jgi:rubrerythrin